jgi:hypothetical protein
MSLLPLHLCLIFYTSIFIAEPHIPGHIPPIFSETLPTYYTPGALGTDSNWCSRLFHSTLRCITGSVVRTNYAVSWRNNRVTYRSDQPAMAL